jgi:uncharacterized RDD family membrane protein YckC
MRELLVIRTPENVSFEHELAALGSRALAWVIDLVAIIGLILGASIALSSTLSRLGGLGTAVQLIVVFLIQWGYGAVLEWGFHGKTLGKAILGLRTVSDRGLRITFLEAAIRNLVRTVDFLPVVYGVGGATALLDPKGRRLGDLAAGTVVVQERRAPRPASFLPPSERHNTFASDPAVLLAGAPHHPAGARDPRGPLPPARAAADLGAPRALRGSRRAPLGPPRPTPPALLLGGEVRGAARRDRPRPGHAVPCHTVSARLTACAAPRLARDSVALLGSLVLFVRARVLPLPASVARDLGV